MKSVHRSPARDYFVLAEAPADADTAVISEYPPGPQTWEFGLGVPLAEKLGASVRVQFSRRYDGRRLRDFQANTLGLVLASARARAVLEPLAGRDVELVPLAIPFAAAGSARARRSI